MCGLTGTVVFDEGSFRVDRSLINTMRDTMIHRGPDGSGTWIRDDRRVGFGHRRLAIIEPEETAAQPMANQDGSLRLIYNGEIYNHAEIRNELNRRGNYTWKTDHSDTEVVLHAFEEWGIDCIERFRGMFAFALWDERRDSLWLVRDRLGIKPLYYSIHDNRISFGSEIKAILEDPDQKRSVHQEAFYHYLSFLTNPAPQTLFDGIKKLEPGTWMRVDLDGTTEQTKYWDVLDNVDSIKDLPEDELAEQILETLRESVSYRKVSDVPVGVFLSGGLDSSTNLSLFSEGESDPVKTFSIGYDRDYDSYANELQYARIMAENTGADHFEKKLTVDNLVEFLPEMVRLQDEPIGDPVCIPVYYVSKLARENGVKVCQVGEGADELFLGYRTWARALQLQKYNQFPVPNFMKRAGLGFLEWIDRDKEFYYEWLRRGIKNQPIFWGGAEAFPETHKKEIVSKQIQERFRGRTSWEAIDPIRKRYEKKKKEDHEYNWMSYVDLNFRLPELLLMRVDKMAMGVGLETRVPFLDHKLVELAMSIPASLKTKNNESKHLLKKAVKGRVPNEIINRKKQGFGVPLNEWFIEGLDQKYKQELIDFSAQTNFFSRKGIEELLDMGRGARTWYVLNFFYWWKEFIGN